jgi:glyoxylase-like metal-dependent hydrolase (beta-lactamase superfamily II)
MQEIGRGVYIETNYAGVVLGAINLAHGLLLIDAPHRPDDVRSWRASLLNLGGGVDRLLINLDAHIDRTLGARAMECTVVAHEKTAEVYRTRPTAFKSQAVETGADWELSNGLGSIRWAPPEINFSHHLMIHWDESPAILEHHPGPHGGAIWVTLPDAHIVFVGDAVIPEQPPFLANADLTAWVETLRLLLSPTYQDFLVVGGRTGLVTMGQVRKQLVYLELIRERLDALAEQKVNPEQTEMLIPELIKGMEILPYRQEQFIQRLRWGLNHYYSRHYRTTSMDDIEELTSQ